jgi:hypothetical protein
MGAMLVARDTRNAPPAARSTAPETLGPLFEELAALDAEVFDAFHNCASVKALG